MGTAFANLLDLEELARARLPRETFDYIAGGAEGEVSLRRNREAFEHWALRPHVLVDVSRRDTATTVLGERVSAPILVAPTAFHGLAHPEGEVATAHAAAAFGTIMVAATLANRSLEEVAATGPEPRWFQLYVFQDRRIAERLIARAETAGYRALCLTVDAPVVGWRDRDERNAFDLPPGLGVPNLEREHYPDPPAMGWGIAGHLAQDLTWKDLDWLQSLTDLPLVVKGIMTAEDAATAVDHRVAGIVVSNHGGRQLDGTIGTIDALPEVVEAVAGKAEVFVDGGVRRGTDVLKALALGAKAVLVGRPVLYGLALAGAEAALAALRHLQVELDLAMALCGRPTIADIDGSLVQRV